MSREGEKQRRNRILSWAINLAGLLALCLILYLGGAEAWQQIVQGDWRYVLAALAVQLLWNLAAAWRWSLIANWLVGSEICAFRYFLTYHMIGMLAGQVVPVTVGMLGARPVALNLSQQVPLGRSAMSVLVDKLFDLILALLLAVPAMLFLVGWMGRPLALWIMGGMAVAGAVLIFWRYEQAVRLLGRLGARFAGPILGRVPRVGPRLLRQLERLSTETLLENRIALQTFLLTLVMYGLLSVRLFFVAQALRLEIPWHVLAMGIAVTQLTLVFAVTPGSLGFLEGGWAAVLGLAGLPQSIATFVIGRRAFVLVFTLVGTLLSFGWIRESPARLFRAMLEASRQPPREGSQAGTGPAVDGVSGELDAGSYGETK